MTARLTMKGHLLIRSFLISCALGASLIAPAFANHKTGDYPLPDLVVMGDFDQDGNVDLAVNVSGFDTIAILTGDGQGGFALKGHVETDTLPKGLVAADVNADGRLDLVSANQWGYRIRLYFGDGFGGFVFANELNGDGEPTRVAVGDLNNDGKLDLIANAQEEGNILIYFGDGNGGFSNVATELEGLQNNYALGVADLNNDGNLDIAATDLGGKHPTETDVAIYLSDGTGAFTEPGEFAVGPGASTLALGDLNLDGNIDIVVSGPGSGTHTGLFVATYLNDGAGNFARKQVIALGPGAVDGEMATGDFNEDGNLDLAFPVPYSQTETPSTTVLIFLGDGAGGLTTGQPVNVGQAPDTALAADFNQDGHLDLAVTNRTDGTLSILFGDGRGTFTTHEVIPVADLPMP
jgi:hypothetical protein